MIKDIHKALSGQKFDLSDEKLLQGQIEMVLSEAGILVESEYRLTAKDIADFFCDGIVLEIKIKGSASSIFKQCQRYCALQQVKELLLITNRSMGFPAEIYGKPCYVLNLGKAWL